MPFPRRVQDPVRDRRAVDSLNFTLQSQQGLEKHTLPEKYKVTFCRKFVSSFRRKYSDEDNYDLKVWKHDVQSGKRPHTGDNTKGNMRGEETF